MRRKNRKALEADAREQWGHDVCVCGQEHRTRRFVYREPGSLLDKVLSVVVNIEYNRAVVEASKYPYKPVEYPVPSWNVIAFEYQMTVASVLHRWFGITWVDAA